MNAVRVVTRGSALARIQTDLAVAALRARYPERAFEVISVDTEGDNDRTTPLSQLGGRGVFVGGLRRALQDGRADLAVHSLKDVPTIQADGLTIAGVLERGDPRDVLVSRESVRLADLPGGSRVGTSSTRRTEMVRCLRPDLESVPIRGNVDTRIRKLREGEVDALILAGAGLQRLGRLDEITEWLSAEDFIPAPAQGVIGIECRSDDHAVVQLLASIDHAPSRAAATAERAFLAVQGSNCSLPVGALATVDGTRLTLRGTLSGDPGSAGELSGPAGDAAEIGRALGLKLRELLPRSVQ